MISDKGSFRNYVWTQRGREGGQNVPKLKHVLLEEKHKAISEKNIRKPNPNG
jgi:hypothetical protein